MHMSLSLPLVPGRIHSRTSRATRMFSTKMLPVLSLSQLHCLWVCLSKLYRITTEPVHLHTEMVESLCGCACSIFFTFSQSNTSQPVACFAA
eukprot:1160521-Pelagomonas_calceolata.AAC.3